MLFFCMVGVIYYCSRVLRIPHHDAISMHIRERMHFSLLSILLSKYAYSRVVLVRSNIIIYIYIYIYDYIYIIFELANY